MKKAKNKTPKTKRNEINKYLVSFVSWLKGFGRDVVKAFGSKETALSVMLVLIAIALLIGGFIYITRPPAGSDTDAPQTVVEDGFIHPLTGELLSAPLEEIPDIYAVMVENAADAWPLTGIDDAFLIYEAPVEGDIPRFLALFDSSKELPKIGPVRSARPYYLDWVQPFAALYAHVGGSPEALEELKVRPIRDLNEFAFGNYFYRSSNRLAPHNVYTDSGRLGRAASIVEPDSEPQLGFALGELDASSAPESVTIDWMRGTTYDVTWEYDSETESFLRYQGRSPMILEDGSRVYASDIVLIETDMETIDEVGRKRITTTGSGDALVVTKQGSIEATWRKASESAPLRIVDSSGDDVILEGGQIWVQILRSIDAQVEITERAE